MARVALVVPSLHPSKELFLPFIADARTRGFTRIIVVDDGSGPEFRDVFDELSEGFGCVVLRHETNLGKGAALKSAFEHCEKSRDRISAVVTADSDGQHSAEDLVRVAKRTLDCITLQRPAVVLGVRTFDADTVPSKSRVGNRMTSGVVHLFFGRRLTDTQTGLRGFPLDLAVRSIRVAGERFDYEMNVLLWLLATRVPIEEVPIETIYHDLSNSVSHFRPVLDSTRIYAVILRQFVRFAGASILSAALDIALYVVLLDFVLPENRLPQHVAAAVVLARILSSLFNFALNRWLVFHDNSRPVTPLLRYVMLAAVILVASTLGTTALSAISQGHDVWAKVIVDGALFVSSYFVQQRWVFRDRVLERG